MKNLPAEQDEESYGPMMQACLPQERAIIEGIFAGLSGAEAARQAGHECSTPEAFARVAHRALHRDRVQAAIVEYTAKAARVLGPLAVRAQSDILSTVNHKDRGKISVAVLERISPTIQRVDAHVLHEIVDHRQDALIQLKALLALGVARERLEELFGFTGLPMLERQLADETKTPIIDASFVEIAPDELEADIERQMKDL